MVFVVIQFTCIGILVITSAIPFHFHLAFLPLTIGIILGVWAIFTMKKSKLRITPAVATHAKLITDGPYAYIRHPMYTAVLILSFGLLLTSFTIFRFVIYIILFIDLILKLMYEEQLLQRSFPGYRAYMKRSKRLIPCVW